MGMLQLGDVFQLTLLAAGDAFRNMGSGFRDKKEHFQPTDLIVWGLAFAGVFAGLIVLSRIVARHDKAELYNSPRALFRALSKVHGLSAQERRVLKRLARQRNLDPVASVFLTPEAFDTETLGKSLAGQADRIRALESRLFAVSLPSDRSEAAEEVTSS